MARINRRLVLALTALYFTSFGLAQPQKKDREPVFRVEIGHFPFPLRDETVQERIQVLDKNMTDWDKLWGETNEYWQSANFAVSIEAEESDIRSMAIQDTNIDSETMDKLMEKAKKFYNKDLAKYNDNRDQLWNAEAIDLSYRFLDAIDEEFKNVQYRYLAAYAGVGLSVSCKNDIDGLLKKMSEWDKAGMAAATTIMALLPTFLAFGSLFVPRSSEAFATSWLIGLGAALFTFGLPTKSISCIRRKKVIELGSLNKEVLDEIGELAKNKTEPSTEDDDTDDSDPVTLRDLQDLQQWTQPKPPHKYMKEFSDLRKAVKRYEDRYHWWHIPAALIAACQGVIFGIAIEPLLKSVGIPNSLFGCADEGWTGLYLTISSCANAVFRLTMWQLADHEVVNIYHLTDKAKIHLNELKQALEKLEEPNTAATHMPPLYAPAMSFLHDITNSILTRIIPKYKRTLPEQHPERTRTLLQPMKDRFASAKIFFRNPLSALISGFIGDNKAAPRHRPLVVLIHLSTKGRTQLRTLFTGFIECSLLLVLTFFFAAQWGGNLFITTIALALLLLFVTVGRVLAILYVWLSAQTWGLHTINCDDQNEILGCLRIVCSMQGVLVTVNGAHYYDGYRLDHSDDFPAWRQRYAAGEFDEPTGSKKDTLPSVEPPKQNVIVLESKRDQGSSTGVSV